MSCEVKVMTYVLNVRVTQRGHRHTVLPNFLVSLFRRYHTHCCEFRGVFVIKWCTNLIWSVIHELGIPRDLIDVAFQVAALDIGRLEAPVKRLAFGLVVTDEIKLFARGGWLRVVGWQLNLLPSRRSAIRLVCTDVYANRSTNQSMLSLQRHRIRLIEPTRYSSLGDGKCFVKSDTFHGDNWVLRVDGHIRISSAGVFRCRRVRHGMGLIK